MTSNSPARMVRAPRREEISRASVLGPDDVVPCMSMCATCNLRELCPACCGLTGPERDIAERLVVSRPRVRRGDSLYRSGDRFTCLYAVRNGFFKSTAALENGRDQVTGYTMAGEVLGMDGIGPERHSCTTIALEDSEVYAITFSALQELVRALPSLQRNFCKVMSHEIAREHGLILLLGSMTAEQRLAMFLLNMSQRFAAHGRSPSEFDLRMTRDEIGSYLGLTLETVSRTFSRLQQEGLITVQKRLIRILDRAGLEQVMRREAH